MPSAIRYKAPSPAAIAVQVLLRKTSNYFKKMAGLQTDDLTYTAALRDVTRHEFELQQRGLLSDGKSESVENEFDNLNVAGEDGLIYPTKGEEKTLRRIPDAVPWNAYRMFYSFLVCGIMTDNAFLSCRRHRVGGAVFGQLSHLKSFKIHLCLILVLLIYQYYGATAVFVRDYGIYDFHRRSKC